jgi:hypothetical protein
LLSALERVLAKAAVSLLKKPGRPAICWSGAICRARLNNEEYIDVRLRDGDGNAKAEDAVASHVRLEMNALHD